MDRIYLDYAASTPVDPLVLEAMQPYFSEKFGNPGSLHSFGQEAIAAVDESRETIAKAIGADFREIIFTGSATEANNLALRGSVKGSRVWGLGYRDKNNTALNPSGYTLHPRIIVSTIEHESVLETARDLERGGVEVIYLPVDRNGFVDLKKLEESLSENTVLVSVMYANNEIGTVQPIAEISKIVSDFRKKLEMRNEKLGRSTSSSLMSHVSYPLFHTDASQAFQLLDCDVNKLGVDFMTLSAHKMYGPKGVGALYCRVRSQESGVRSNKNLTRDSFNLTPLVTGGGQEFGLRSGTENVPLIVGFAKAVELVSHSRELENKKIVGLRDYFWRGLKKICPTARTNTDLTRTDTEVVQTDTDKKVFIGKSPYESASSQYQSVSLPNIMSICFPGKKAEELLTKFDLAGLAASSGSACRSRAIESSYVIEALGFGKERAKSSIRFSFGRPTTKEEVDKALEIIRISVKLKNQNEK